MFFVLGLLLICLAVLFALFLHRQYGDKVEKVPPVYLLILLAMLTSGAVGMFGSVLSLLWRILP